MPATCGTRLSVGALENYENENTFEGWICLSERERERERALHFKTRFDDKEWAISSFRMYKQKTSHKI